MSIRPAPILLAALLGAVVAGCGAEPPAAGVPSFYQRLDEGASLDEQAAAAMINAYRARKGLQPLALDPALSAQARQRATTVAATDTSTWGEVPRVQAVAAGSDRGVRRERVSAGYRTMAEAFSGWRDSPPHEAVLLERAGTRLGIAAVDRPGTKYRVYWAVIVE